MESRRKIPRRFIVWAAVALTGSVLIFVVGSDLYAHLVAFLVFLVIWGMVWRIAVGIYQSRPGSQTKR